MIRRPPRSTQSRSSAASDVYKRQVLCPPQGDAWVIGGAALYRQALPLASTALVTEIDADYEGDAFAPQFGPEWSETERARQVSTTGLSFSFVTYCKNTGV